MGCKMKMKPRPLFKWSVTIRWGTDPQETASYDFATERELHTFMRGVNEACGWLSYEVLKSTIPVDESNSDQ